MMPTLEQQELAVAEFVAESKEYAVHCVRYRFNNVSDRFPDLYLDEVDHASLVSVTDPDMKLIDHCILRFARIGRDSPDVDAHCLNSILKGKNQSIYSAVFTGVGLPALAWHYYLLGGKKRKLVRRGLKQKCKDIFRELLQAIDC
jgi:hypothetical protein